MEQKQQPESCVKRKQNNNWKKLSDGELPSYGTDKVFGHTEAALARTFGMVALCTNLQPQLPESTL